MISLRRWSSVVLLAAVVGCPEGVDPVVPQGATVEISAGSGQSFVVASPAPTPLAVLVKDVSGAPLSGIPVAWSVTSGGGTVTASSNTGNDGIATTTYTAGTTSGPKVIAATVPGAGGSPISFSLTVMPGAAKRLVKSSGDLQSGSTGQPLPAPLTVTAVDTFGNGVQGVAVTWAITGGSATLNPANGTTNAQGIASTAVTPTALGPVAVSAASAGLTGSPVAFSETVTLGVTLTATIPIPANYGLHDQFIRGGIAFLCAWNTGLLIYDVGGGGIGGTPAVPKLIGSVVTNANGVSGGPSVHNAWWYWPPNNGVKKYVFVGQEGPPSTGDIHVVDVSDMANPVEVAYYHMAGLGAPVDSAGVHNFWVDEVNEILYAAYYNGGVVALNVSGTLVGNLANREIARIRPGGVGNTLTWGVQLYNGSLYATDMRSGFWQLKLAGGVFQAVGGNNVPERFSSDQWVANGFAYSGTWGNRGVIGNALKIWQLNGTGLPVLVDSIITAGIGTVSDVEVSTDGRMLMFSAENGPNTGVYFYSLVANPARPTFIGSYPVAAGVHTATFAEINGRRYVFATRNPVGGPALLILDVTPINP